LKIRTKNKPKQEKKKVPNTWQLFKKTWLELTTFWRPISGVLIVYGSLYYLLVMGLSFSTELPELTSGDSRLEQALNSVSTVFSNGSLMGYNQSDSTGLFQLILFLIASMAIVWTLRKLQGLKKTKIRDAYYLGTATLIPTILVSIVTLLTLIPSALGSSILSVSLQASGNQTEVIIIGIIAGLLLFLSIYLLAMIWPAFYIVTLGQTRPIQAIRSATKITKGNRFSIIRKSIILMIVLILLTFGLIIPIAMISPTAVPFMALIIMLLNFAIAHTYLYNLYRSLI
jgi:hypothetical protein